MFKETYTKWIFIYWIYEQSFNKKCDTVYIFENIFCADKDDPKMNAANN